MIQDYCSSYVWNDRWQDNPKEEHLWTQKAQVFPFEVILEQIKSFLHYQWLRLSNSTAPTGSTYWFEIQVNAQVRAIPMTVCIWKKRNFPQKLFEEMHMGLDINTTPTKSTYSFKKSSQCFCQGTVNDQWTSCWTKIYFLLLLLNEEQVTTKTTPKRSTYA